MKCLKVELLDFDSYMFDILWHYMCMVGLNGNLWLPEAAGMDTNGCDTVPTAIRTPRGTVPGFSGTQPREPNGKNRQKDQK